MSATLGILGTVAAVLYAIYAAFQIATGIIRFVVRFIQSRRKPKPVPTARSGPEATAEQRAELARMKARGRVDHTPCSWCDDRGERLDATYPYELVACHRGCKKPADVV